ncbi:MAG: TatD family deoxyribonuclease [Solirubrobacterales bacterium]|nr:TatD family deoxyribonuclease [Solirubrobacterales bacterium]
MAILPPIDAHAHVLTNINGRELRALRSVVFAVTREPSEWAAAAARRDEFCIWGLGCHPGVAAAVAGFDRDLLEELVATTPLIGEVGLDGSSRVPISEQRRVFRAALEVARDKSRLVSIHSVRASGEVLAEIEAVGGIPGAILHWWRGNASETRRAVDLGCFFSLNGAEALRPKVMSSLPVHRVLTETDFPHTRRSDKSADRPGAVATIERALAEAWSMSDDDVRLQLWKNLASICTATRTSSSLPRRVQGGLLTIR